MMLSAIAAMASNRTIGVENKLPWSLSEDLNYFKEMTRGKIIIMGRKTFDSLPFALPGRYHIVITRNSDYVPAHQVKDNQLAIVISLEAAIQRADEILKMSGNQFSNEVFVIGGAEIYAQSLKYLKRIYLTVIEQEFAGDAFFPIFNEKEFKLIKKDPRTEPLPYSFRTYEKK